MASINANLRTWLLTSVVAFLCCVFASALLVIFAHRITQFGLAQSLYYVLLVVVGLLTAGFLFGALRSYGKYKGKVLSGTLELGGPVVIVVIIVLVGLTYASPTSTFNLVIRPHGPLGQTDVLRTGTVTVFLGTNPRTEQIGSNGQAQFNEVPAAFLGAEVTATADVPGYELVDRTPQRIPPGKILYVAMAPEHPNSELRGRFLTEDGRPVAKAYVEVNQGLASGHTDEHGDFSIRVPIKQGSVVHLSADLDGVPGYDNSVTISDSLKLTFVPKRVRAQPNR